MSSATLRGCATLAPMTVARMVGVTFQCRRCRGPAETTAPKPGWCGRGLSHETARTRVLFPAGPRGACRELARDAERLPSDIGDRAGEAVRWPLRLPQRGRETSATAGFGR